MDNPDLQFDRAQFDGAASQSACTRCSTPLHGAYFEVNGHTVCEACCYQLREAAPAGSRMGRVLRATAAGVGAGLAGAILYWGILAATGYEFGLIAIVVGFAVGKAVRWGSGDRGGRAYQTLAIALTYLSIVSAYVPMIVTEILKQNTAAQTQSASADGRVLPAADSKATPEPQPASGDGRPVGLAALAVGLGALLLFACAAPFLAGASNIMGMIIIGIGMYEAWKLNRRVPLVITGPHVLAATGVADTGQ
jgi:predicted lipid-binding transport protein (Tim44 family)